MAPNVGLLFLVPDDYQHMDAIQRTIEKVATPKYRVAVTTWRNLIGRLEAEGLNETNEVFRDFHAFLKKWFAVEPITFEERELHMIYSRDVGKAYSNLIDFVDQTSDILTRSGYDISRSRNSYEYGFYGKDVSGKRLTWFGIYYGHWESNGCPLTLGVERTLQLPKSLSRRLGESPTEDVGWNIYDIPESALLKKDSQVALAGVLKSVLNCGKQRKKRT